jgi:hypothetical protein
LDAVVAALLVAAYSFHVRTLRLYRLVAKATVMPGAQCPDNIYFHRLEVSQVAIKKISSL